MLGRGKAKAVAEYEATGETERVYHEIKQTLRVTGVNLNFRTWAGFDHFLPLAWDAIRPNLETLAFERAADRVRIEAAESVPAIGPLAVASRVALGQSQTFQVRAALDLYHYINPKLLVLTSAVRLSLKGDTIGNGGAGSPELITRGAPATMYAMEMESEEPDDQQLQQLFKDIKETLALDSVNSDYRTLALWPPYLAAVWKRLKPIVQTSEYRQRADALRQTSRSLARELPHAIPLTRQAVKEAGEDPDAVLQVTEKFEQLLPGLILNVALCKLDWCEESELVHSPFPAATRDRRPRGVV